MRTKTWVGGGCTILQIRKKSFLFGLIFRECQKITVGNYDLIVLVDSSTCLCNHVTGSRVQRQRAHHKNQMKSVAYCSRRWFATAISLQIRARSLQTRVLPLSARRWNSMNVRIAVQTSAGANRRASTCIATPLSVSRASE